MRLRKRKTPAPMTPAQIAAARQLARETLPEGEGGNA